MKFVISASVLSAMVFYSSLLPFLHSLNLYISATIHKNYMFLLCNGLLVFIVRNSGLIGNSGNRNGPGAEVLGPAMPDDCRKVEGKIGSDEERENGSLIKEESEIVITEDEDEDEEEEGFNFYDDDEEEEEEEEEVGALSNEELNKKCEEFIRKMKEGIKFESQQVLVL